MDPSDRDLERFVRSITFGGPDECWPWTGGTMNKGLYGDFRWGGRSQPTRTGAHRVSFWVANGRWPIEASHTCGNSLCCNPDHLVEESHQENAARAVMFNAKKVTCPKGHEYDVVYLTPRGVERKCNRCRRERHAATKIRTI